MIAVETLRSLLTADLEHVAGAVLADMSKSAAPSCAAATAMAQMDHPAPRRKRGLALNSSTMKGCQRL
jgi:hypothetical protein